MTRRILIGANTFGTSLLPGDVIKRGDIIDVTDEVAINLDSHVWHDSANNAFPVFVHPEDPMAAKYMDQEEVPVKKKRKKRVVTRKKKSVKSEGTRSKKSS